ncbi:MAG TPA: hypothetical protein VMF50_17690 [Candidatus Binataceae bacterium]|nr:hypothetical protein [Candidatus Binataceae bacterium]
MNVASGLMPPVRIIYLFGVADVAGAVPGLAALFAFFLHRYTLEVEIFRSLAMALAFLPAATSDMTLLQSTLLA